MTVDLLWARWSRASALGGAGGGFCPQRRNRYILMPESRFGDKNTIGLTGFYERLAPLSDNRNFTFDTLKTPPYKRGSHGERGVPKTRRVIAAKGCLTQSVPVRRRSRLSGRALYASSVRKGIRRRRRTSVLRHGRFRRREFGMSDASRARVISDGISKRFLREAR